ncbi:MAG: hypothetical protein ACRDKZ_01455 [Actinomycetota bacterium]
MRAKALALATAAVLVVVTAGAGAGAGGANGSARKGHKHSATKALWGKQIRKLAGPLAEARVATAKYATDLDAALADGYRIITPNIPDMGYHYLNPSITDFDVTRPQILVYQRDGNDFTLGALEWVFPEKPKKKPLPGARYGSFGAACHYDDGTFVFEDTETQCADTSPDTGSPFVFWHPDLVTMHVWLWHPNPHGLFSGTNRWVRPFNDDQV